MVGGGGGETVHTERESGAVSDDRKLKAWASVNNSSLREGKGLTGQWEDP